MYKFLLISQLFLFVQLTNGQPNLVLNGSFEDFKNCPVDQSASSIKLDSNLNANYWFSFGGYGNEAVYFNSCSNPLPFSWGFGVPLNNGGYQLTKSGNGYAAFHPTAYFFINNIGLKNDYMGTRLKDKCISRLFYKGGFYCAATGIIITQSDAIRILKISSLGMLFCNSIPKLKNDNHIELPAQINNDPSSILSDTINWMEVSGIFEADGTEQ